MSIITPTNFNVQNQLNIDSRLIQADIASRNLISTPTRYFGMIVHVLDSDGSNNPNTYILQKGTTSIDIFDNGNWQSLAELSGGWNTVGTTTLTGDVIIDGGPSSLTLKQSVSPPLHSGLQISSGLVALFQGTTVSDYSAATRGLKVSTTGIEAKGAPINYAIDLSGSYVDRSLVDKKFIEGGGTVQPDRVGFNLTIGDVTTPTEGQIWYNNTSNKFRVFQGVGPAEDIITFKMAYVQLSQSQIQSLNTTSIEVIPQPASGEYIQIIAASASLNYNGTAYAVASKLRLIYQGLTATLLADSFVSFIAGVNDQVTSLFKSTVSGGQLSKNKALHIYADADATGAGGTIDVYVQYVIINTN